MRNRYKSLFVETPEKTNERFVEKNIEKNKLELKMENKKSMQIQNDDLFDASANTILMLNQVLSELSQLNEKIENLQKNMVLKETNESTPEKVAESNQNKRKITLIRDNNGKIVGADVIDVVDTSSEKIVESKETKEEGEAQ
jgi:ribosomal protein L16 Arg81 hydroxylase